MRRRHLIAGAVAVAALGGGTAAAVAATGGDKATEQAVLADAAKRLGVSATDLRSALAGAEDAQLQAAVKAGRLTQAQADAIEQHRRADGNVLGFGRGPGPGFGRPGPHGGPFLLRDAAGAIGISESRLLTQLRDGKTLTAIAKAHGKTLAEVRSAVEKAATDRLDADLKAGRITQSQHDDAIAELDELLDRLGDLGRFRGFGPPGDEHRPS